MDERVGVTQFLTELRALADVPAPEPSAELAALLGGATPLGPRRRLRRGVVVRTIVVAAAVIAALVLAAAGHRLPAPAQRLVSTVVDTITPFTISPDVRHHAPALVPLPVPPAASDGAEDPSATAHPPVGGQPSMSGPGASSDPSPSRDDGPSDQPSSAPGGEDRSSGAAGGDVNPGGTGGGDDGSETRPAPALRTPTAGRSSGPERERQAPPSGGPTEPGDSPDPSGEH